MEMIIDNKNNKLSRNRKRRINCKNRHSSNEKIILNEIKSEKKKKIKNLDKIRQLKILLVNKRYAKDPKKLENALKVLDKIEVFDKNLHEIKYEILEDYEGDFELIGTLIVGDQTKQTHIRFRKMDAFESHINKIDNDYDADDTTFNGYIYKIDTPIFNKVNRSRYSNGVVFDKIIIEYQGNNCFIPTKRYCFIKCINFLTGQDYREQYLDFTRNEEKTIEYHDNG